MGCSQVAGKAREAGEAGEAGEAAIFQRELIHFMYTKCIDTIQ